MRLVLHMVVRNEADRYLDSVLTDILPRVDGAFVVDDQSSDDTQEILRSHEVTTLVRPDFIMSYEQNATILRYFSWIAMYDAMDIEQDDWILQLDADEYITGNLRQALTILHAGGFVGADIPMSYLWSLHPPRALTNYNFSSSVRLVQASAGEQTFKPNARVPKYGSGPECYIGDLGLHLMNLSYADELDRELRMERHGVSELIDPILTIPIEGMPSVWIGVK